MSALAINAQTGDKALEGAKFFDNWSVELKAGAVTPLKNAPFFKSMRPAFGLSLNKQVTPVFGLGFQGMGYVNTSESKTAFDASDVSVLGRVNLMNLFGGYRGEPRTFEVEAVTGIGWLHYYMDGPGDTNSWSTRLGMNFNFNLGEERAWTVGIKPALVYDMQGAPSGKTGFNANYAAFELTAGLAYHFMCSNGTRHFTLVDAYDMAEVAELNAAVNDLRAQVNERDRMLTASAQKVNHMKQALDDCQNRTVEVETVVNRVPETLVSFRQGSAVVDASQKPNVERVATYLKKHAEATVVIKGYASPEGNLDYNEKLADKRAQAVRSILVNTYKIDAARITSGGEGIGNMFSEPDWNRVSICTISQ